MERATYRVEHYRGFHITAGVWHTHKDSGFQYSFNVEPIPGVALPDHLSSQRGRGALPSFEAATSTAIEEAKAWIDRETARWILAELNCAEPTPDNFAEPPSVNSPEFERPESKRKTSFLLFPLRLFASTKKA